jgi:PAS domain S-box-containing protein
MDNLSGSFGEVAEERDENGVLLGLIGTVTDITELRIAREELERSRAELESRVRERTEELREAAMVVDQMEDAVIRSDLDGNIVSWNRAAERLFGYRAGEMIGRSTFLLTPPEHRTGATEIKRRVREGESLYRIETVRMRKGWERSWMSTCQSFRFEMTMERLLGTTAIVRNISGAEARGGTIAPIVPEIAPCPG